MSARCLYLWLALWAGWAALENADLRVRWEPERVRMEWGGFRCELRGLWGSN